MSNNSRMIDDRNRKTQIVDFYNGALQESTKPRRTKKRMTGAEVRRDTFKKVCQRLLPITLAAGIAIGGLGFSAVDRIVDNWDSNSYITERVHNFHSNYISPNTYHITYEDEEGKIVHGHAYRYYEISEGIKNAPNQDEAIYFCYLNLGSLQTGRVIDFVGYDTFMGYIQSKGFETLEEYEEFMKKEVELRYNTNEGNKELEEMMNEHAITDDVEVNSLGGK